MIVVADTSVLLNLCRVGHGGLFKGLFREVVIPPEVAAEFVALTISSSRFSGLRLPSGIREQSPIALLPAVRAAEGLDVGEAAALSLAVEIRADAVLIDERRGHEVAVQLGLRTIGLLGVLLRAKATGMVPQISPVVEMLERDAGFWISEKLRYEVLRLAGEMS
jgi:predicted nucleic acid-binding protein